MKTHNENQNFDRLSFWQYAFTFIICFVIFRYPIVSVLTTAREFRWLYPLPILFLAFCGFSIKPLLHSKIRLHLLVWAVLTTVGLYLLLSVRHFAISELIDRTASTAVMFAFMIMLAGSSVGRSPRVFEKVMTIIANVYFYFGGFLIIAEFIAIYVLKLTTTHELQAWIYRGTHSGIDLDYEHLRRVGFLLTKEFGVIGVLASWAYLATRAFKHSKGMFNLRIVMDLLFVAVAIFLADSILSIALLIVLFLVITSKHIEIWTKIRGWEIILGLICVMLFLKLSDTSLRIKGYSIGVVAVSKVFLPSISSCTWQTFVLPINPPGGNCAANELHAYFNIFKVGLPIMLGWYVCLVSPAFMMFKNWLNGHTSNPYLIMAFAFTLATMHYSGAETWGNNYLFLLSVYGAWIFTEQKGAAQKGTDA